MTQLAPLPLLSLFLLLASSLFFSLELPLCLPIQSHLCSNKRSAALSSSPNSHYALHTCRRTYLVWRTFLLRLLLRLSPLPAPPSPLLVPLRKRRVRVPTQLVHTPPPLNSNLRPSSLTRILLLLLLHVLAAVVPVAVAVAVAVAAAGTVPCCLGVQRVAPAAATWPANHSRRF